MATITLDLDGRWMILEDGGRFRGQRFASHVEAIRLAKAAGVEDLYIPSRDLEAAVGAPVRAGRAYEDNEGGLNMPAYKIEWLYDAQHGGRFIVHSCAPFRFPEIRETFRSIKEARRAMFAALEGKERDNA